LRLRVGGATMNAIPMKAPVLAAILLVLGCLAAADSHARGGNNNPIRLEGQIRELTDSGGGVTIRLHRDRYPIVAHEETRVRWLDGRRAPVSELRVGDSIRVEGNQEQDSITADRITILLRVERR